MRQYQISRDYGVTWFNIDDAGALKICGGMLSYLAMATLNGDAGFMPPLDVNPERVMVRGKP